jgi:hypothetical protein
MRWTSVTISLLLSLGVLHLASAQSDSSSAAKGGAVERTDELYGMKLVSIPLNDASAGQWEEIWVNTNTHTVTAVWKLKAKDGKPSEKREVFKAKEQRTVTFPKGAVAARIFLAYKDDDEKWLQQNREDFKHGGGKEKIEQEDTTN